LFVQPYQLEELRFACCFRVYYRWRTHRVEASAGRTDVMVLASLLPTETVAAAAGKMKGRVSKWSPSSRITYT
jgi:hypothetical protein